MMGVGWGGTVSHTSHVRLSALMCDAHYNITRGVYTKDAAIHCAAHIVSQSISVLILVYSFISVA